MLNWVENFSHNLPAKSLMLTYRLDITLVEKTDSKLAKGLHLIIIMKSSNDNHKGNMVMMVTVTVVAVC